MATANTTPEIQAQIDQLKQRIADLTALVVPEVNISDPIAGPDVLPNPTQTDIVDQINASFAIATGALQTTTSALVTTVDNLLEDPTLSGNTTANGTLTIIGSTVANGGLTVVGATTANGTLAVSGNTQASSLGVGIAASGSVGEIRASDNITAYYSSDVKLKENIRPIPNALSIVGAVGGKLFDWTDDYVQSRGGEDGYFIRKNDFGVVAQDLQSVFDVAIRQRPDGTLAVDYEKLCAVAFAAINELKSELDELKQIQRQ